MIWEKKWDLIFYMYICYLFNVCANKLDYLHKYKLSNHGLKSF